MKYTVCKKIYMLEDFFFIKSLLFWVQVCTGKLIDQKIQVNRNHLSSAYTPLKSHISSMNILCILRFAKNCTRENKDTTFDHEIAKFDNSRKFPLIRYVHGNDANSSWCIRYAKCHGHKLKTTCHNGKMLVQTSGPWEGCPFHDFWRGIQGIVLHVLQCNTNL